MNRKIKFRGWHKEGEMMTVPLELSNSNCNFDEDFYEVMQFTGLKDIDEKEIYEGDILESIYLKGRAWYKKRFVVEIIESCWGFETSWRIIFNKLIPSSTKEQKRELLRFLENPKEIIGNIYENPELLNDALPKKDEVEE